MPIYGARITTSNQEWLIQFIANLIRQYPQMGASEARRIAIANFPHFIALDPEEALAIYLRRQEAQAIDSTVD